MKNGIKLLLSLFIVAITQAAFAQAPANDLCTNATNLDTLVAGIQVCQAGSNDHANPEFPYAQVTGCRPSGATSTADTARDVWYKFTTAAGATELKLKINGTLPSINVGLYTGSCGSLTGVECGTSAVDSFSYTFRNLLGNTTYYLQVSGDTIIDTGSFTICVTNIIPPANDSCAHATAFGALVPNVLRCLPGTINNAGQELPFHSLTGCRPSNHPMSANGGDVWYTFTTPAGGTKLHMQLAGTVDSVNIGIYSGSCNSLGGVNCGTSYTSSFDYTFDQLQGNTTYYIQVEGQSISDTGTFNLCLTSIIPPPNDACSNATNFGTLSLGSQSCRSGTNVNAGPEFPYPFQPFCFPGGITANPSSDVWYTFTTPAGSNQLAVNISGTLDTLNVAIYRGSCGSLVGVGCESVTNGNYTHTFGQFAAGTTYYIQVSGGSVADTGNFNLCLTSSFNSTACINNGFVNVTPLPTNGTYSAGQTVQFCYTITSYNQLSSNWLHGITIIPGAGWEPTSFTTVSVPASCDGQGTWGYYARDSSTATHQIFGPGFFYDSPLGGPFDGIPGNNFGDNCSNHTWTFCWTYTVKTGPCVANSTDLSMTIRPSSDGMSGSWSSLQCTGDPASVTNLIRSCCPQPFIFSHSPTCPGQCNGSAKAIGQGTPPFSYHWSNGATTDSISGLCPGTYTVTVVDSTNCSVVASAIIGQPTLPTVNADSIDVKCNGDSSGAAFVRLSNIVPSIQYAWSTTPVGTTDTITGLRPGRYVVTVTFPGGCTVVDSTVVHEPTSLSSTHTSTSASCFGSADGAATVTASGGTPPYRYSWNTTPAVHTPTLFNYPAGTYIVTITDTNGCTKNDTVVIDEPTEIVVNMGSTNATCGPNSTDGTAWVSASGGTGPYFYLWSYNFLGTDTITGLSAGNYTVTVIDNNGCYNSNTIAVASGTSNLAATVTTHNITCSGLSNGSATVVPTGGSGQYTYHWANNQTTATITNLTGGTYLVTVTDGVGCTFTASGYVLDPDPLLLNADSNNISCSGTGRVWVSVNGGTPPYSYHWNTTPAATTDTVSGLPTGTYTVTVTDSNGCTASASTIINNGVGLFVNADSVNVSCPFVSNNGRAYVTVSGGNPPYTKLWSNGGTTDTISGLAPGTYTVTVTDQTGCQTTSTTIVQGGPTVTVDTIGIACHGSASGSAIAVITGGLSPFTYHWNNNGTTDTISGLVAGSYAVTVTDARGCVGINSATLSQPDTLSHTITTSDARCYGTNSGSAEIVVSGGVAPYHYHWSNNDTTSRLNGLPAGGYSVTVTDSNGCTIRDTVTIGSPPVFTAHADSVNVTCPFVSNNGGAYVTVVGGSQPYTYSWSNGGTTDTITGLAPGPYSVTVADQFGCRAIDTTFVLGGPFVVIDTVGITCHGANDGVAIAVASGGTPPYTYTWSTTSTNDTITGLAPGTYTVSVGDGSGCMSINTVTLHDPASLVLTTSLEGVLCYGDSTGSMSVAVTGGTAPYTYHWSNQSTNDTITHLPEGSYQVTVTDAHGCTATASDFVEQSTRIIVIVDSVDVSCPFVSNNGVALVVVTGGSNPYTYHWNNNGTTDTITGLAPGTYVVTVTDDLGCQVIDSTTVHGGPTVRIDTVGISCNGANNGSASAVIISGGTPPFTYNWSTTGTGSSITNLGPGTYTVTVTDASGCQAINTVTLHEPTALTISTTSTNATCNGSNDGRAVTTVTGGTLPYTYAWTGGSTTDTAANLTAGTYHIQVTDAHGCTITDSATITEPIGIVANVTQNSSSCADSPTGSLSVQATGGVAPLHYEWNTSDTTADIVNQYGGTYTVTITDSNGCSVILTDTIHTLNFSIGIAVDPDSNIVAGESVTLTASGSNISSVSWQPGIWLNDSTLTTVIATPDSTTTYYVVAISDSGCVARDSITISVEHNSQWFAPDAFTPNGDGHNDYFNVFAQGQAEVVYLKIYNRWGKLIYDQDGGSPGWDGTFKGKALDQDTYVYYSEIKYKPPGGTEQTLQIKGAFTLLR